MREELLDLLNAVRQGSVRPEDAAERLSAESDLGFAVLDLHRVERTGAPEVVYGEGKTADQIAGIVGRFRDSGQPALVTRLDPERARQVCERVSGCVYEPMARLLWTAPEGVDPFAPRFAGKVCVVSAGTSDEPVAEEAARCAEFFGLEVERVRDVGVAGLHRIVSRVPTLREARVVVVVAGMEGALPSVVAGLVGAPVVAVPTSVGYGANLGGVAALLGMLNACSGGISVVNIDNGFGAALFALRIVRSGP